MFKTILVHVDLSSHAPARMRYAASLAQDHRAHLIGAAMFGVSRAIFPVGYASSPGTLEASYFDPLEQNARRPLAQFEAVATAAELGCGVLVMGCYGHGKLRELCLGGASRTVLAEARIPVLLAH